jgi:hypothetical protein
MFHRFVVVIALAMAAVGLQANARAEDLTASEAQHVRAVILAQLKAFADDDAERAFATATPEVRKAIGNSSLFLALVRGNYPMVYRPVAFGFLPPQQEAGHVVQMVTLRDQDNKTWLAVFSLERQPEGTWRIAGCVVAENSWKTT